MEKMIPFSLREAVLLLDAYLISVVSGQPRLQAVKKVSNELRKMAVNSGYEIDEAYRSESGIYYQMECMESAYVGRTIVKPATQLFRDTVTMYLENKREYDKILAEAKSIVDGKIVLTFSLRESVLLFNAYLSTIVSGKSMQYAVKKASEDLRNLAIYEGREIDATYRDVNSVQCQMASMESAYAGRTILKPATQLFKDTVAMYRENRREYDRILSEARSIVDGNTVSQVKQPLNASASARPSFSTQMLKKGSKESFCSWMINKQNMAENSAKSYASAITNCEQLAIRLGLSETGLYGADLATAQRVKEQLSQTIEYQEINESQHTRYNSALEKYILYLQNQECKIEEILETEPIINYNIEGKWKSNSISFKNSSKYSSGISTILSKYYKYGFRLSSCIELMRIRKYAEKENILLPDLDEELEHEIISSGSIIDGKVFFIEDEVFSKISSIIDDIFNQGVIVIFICKLIEYNEEIFLKYHISSENVLKLLLERVRPQLYIGQNIITRCEKLTELDAITNEIFRVSNGKSIVEINILKNDLPYIPVEKIAWSLSMSHEFVWTSEGKYFKIKYFKIAKEDEYAILTFVDRECRLKGYASITDVPLGNIPEDNYELSEAAITSAVYNTVLKGQYYLNGKILTQDKNTVDIVTLLKESCTGKERCTLSELMECARELTGAPNRQKVMTVLYDTMVRVGADEFVSEHQVHFDVEKIDDLIENAVGDRFTPVKGVATFALFPACGVGWNSYVLESFCYRFSNRFSLSVISFNDKNAGLIVSKKLSLSYTDMLIEAIADSNLALTEKAAGQFFFDNGYTAKRKYARMAEILEKAKKIRAEGDSHVFIHL